MPPISASVSQSSSASTGPTQFGNITSGSIGISPWAIAAVIGVVVVGIIGFFALRK